MRTSSPAPLMIVSSAGPPFVVTETLGGTEASIVTWSRPNPVTIWTEVVPRAGHWSLVAVTWMQPGPGLTPAWSSMTQFNVATSCDNVTTLSTPTSSVYVSVVP